MKTSLFEKLRQPATVVLSAGHGAGDPGAVNGDFKEADEAIIMVDEIVKQLKKRVSRSTLCLMKTASKERSNMSMIATIQATHGRSKSIATPRMVCWRNRRRCVVECITTPARAAQRLASLWRTP